MARSGSPSRYSSYEDDPIYQNVHYTQDISEQMRVPKRIKATGEYFDDHELLSGNGNGIMNSWNFQEKFDMTVPDRIVVLGQDQHLGTRSAPREILLDNSILPSQDPGSVRVSTPPRMISLAEHHFPSASDEPQANSDEQTEEYEQREINEDRRLILSKPKKFTTHNTSELIVNHRESTPPLSQSMMEGLTPSEEVLHLRRQVAKLNRRVLAIEIDSVQRQQREKIIFCIGLAYFLMKTILWLNRN